LEGTISVIDDLEAVVGDIGHEIGGWSPRVCASVGPALDELRAKWEDIGRWALEELDRHSA